MRKFSGVMKLFCIFFYGGYLGLQNYQNLFKWAPKVFTFYCVLIISQFKKRKESWGLRVSLPYLALFGRMKIQNRRNKFASQLTILGAEAQQPAELPPQCPLGNLWGKKRFSGGNWYTLSGTCCSPKEPLKCLQHCLLPIAKISSGFQFRRKFTYNKR